MKIVYALKFKQKHVGNEHLITHYPLAESFRESRFSCRTALAAIASFMPAALVFARDNYADPQGSRARQRARDAHAPMPRTPSDAYRMGRRILISGSRGLTICSLAAALSRKRQSEPRCIHAPSGSDNRLGIVLPVGATKEGLLADSETLAEDNKPRLIDPRNCARLVRQQRLDHRPFKIRQFITTLVHPSLPSRSLNQHPTSLASDL